MADEDQNNNEIVGQDIQNAGVSAEIETSNEPNESQKEQAEAKKS